MKQPFSDGCLLLKTTTFLRSVEGNNEVTTIELKAGLDVIVITSDNATAFSSVTFIIIT